MKRTGTPIRLQRIIRSVLLSAAVVTAACQATPTHAAGDGTSAGWQSSDNPFRGQQPSRWTSTAESGNYDTPVSSPVRSIQPSTRPSSRPASRPVDQRKPTISKQPTSRQPTQSAAPRAQTTQSRWLQPTQTTSAAAPRKKQQVANQPRRTSDDGSVTQETASRAPAVEPKEFVPAADARQLEAPAARHNPNRSGQSSATPAAYKSVVPKPPAAAPRARAQQARPPQSRLPQSRPPRVASNPRQRINTGWVQPLTGGPQLADEEEIPMPYEGDVQGDMGGGYEEGYADGPSMESYDGGYDESYGNGYGDGCPCGPDCPRGPDCQCGDGYCGDGCCDSMGGGICDDGMGGFCGDTCDPSCGYEPGCGAEPTCGCSEGGNCCDCFDLGLGVRDPEACEEVRFRVPKIQELAVFGGVHGFKGPLDRERDSGNFGFHEGFNAGAKVPLTKFGYQFGYQAVHSQLHGDKDTNISDPHTQQFFTAGVFRRNRNGWQFGLAYDILHEERWDAIDFEQIRGQVSFVECGKHEAGLAAAVHMSNYQLLNNGQDDAFTTFQATDQFTLFYRLHGRNGGEGRVYAGVTDDSNTLIGADAFLPVQKYWSIQTGFTYMIPEQSGGTEGASNEAWNLGINLVWHWKGHARKCYSNPYRPLFDVADNGSLIVDDRP